MAKRLPRTRVAMRGLTLSDRFNSFFEADRVSGYQLRLLEPAGESTGGGKQATQHLTLQSGMPGDPVLTVGWVNCANDNVKLRTYGCMQQLIARRFGKRTVVLDAAAYREFFDKATDYFEKNGMHVSIEEEPPEVASGTHPAASVEKSSSSGRWIIIGLLLITIGVALWVFAGGP